MFIAQEDELNHHHYLAGESKRSDYPMDSVLISFCETQVNAAQKNNLKGDREMRCKEDLQPPRSMGNR